MEHYFNGRYGESQIIPLFEVVCIPSKVGSWVGYIKGDEGVVSQGETKAELLSNLKDALRCIAIFRHKLNSK